MKLTRQAMLNRFVEQTHGKGRSVRVTESETFCLYMPQDNHPGCAIGSQKGFREAFGRTRIDGDDGTSIVDLKIKHGAKFKRVFGSTTFEDIEFMERLQCFHDEESCWKSGGQLRVADLRRFCRTEKLTVPTI